MQALSQTNTGDTLSLIHIQMCIRDSNNDAGVFSPYMLSDYTEELASQHELRTVLGDDSFTLANLQNRFKEIMSLTVKPSSNTDLLDVTFNSDGDMVNSNGEYVDAVSYTHLFDSLCAIC